MARRRAGRKTNAALFLLLVGAFASGVLAFTAGTPVPATFTTVAHGVFGLGVIGLVPWKSVIIRRARRIPFAGWSLIVLVVVCLVAGIVQMLGGYGWLGVGPIRVSPIQVHVGAALIGVVAFAWHVLRRRRQRLRPTDVSRRAVLRTGVFGLGLGAAYVALLGVASGTRGDKGRVETGSGRLDADAIPATIWLFDHIPTLDATTYRVDVAGRSLSPGELTDLAQPVRARLDCTSGWYAEATWEGARVADLMDAGALAAARSIEITSTTGYTRRFPITDAGSLWLATRCEGRALSAGTGAPVRLVAPGRRGFWWVKWVASVQLSDVPAWAQSPFPPQ